MRCDSVTLTLRLLSAWTWVTNGPWPWTVGRLGLLKIPSCLRLFKMPLFLTKKEVVHKPYGQSLGHLASFYLFITYTLRNLKSKSKIKVIFALSTSSFRREHTRLLRSILCFFTKAFHRVRFKLTQWMKQLFLTKLLNLGLGHTVINHADGVCGYSEPHKIKIPHGSLRFVTFKVTMLLLCGTGSS